MTEVTQAARDVLKVVAPIQLAEQEWAFVPGPSEIADAPASSLDRLEYATYSPAAIAQAFLAYPSFSLIHDANPSW